MAHCFGLNFVQRQGIMSYEWKLEHAEDKEPLNNLMLKMAIEPNVGLTFFSKFITRDIL